MEEKNVPKKTPSKSPFKNDCSFAGVKPIMVDLPYPEIQVEGPNSFYAKLLQVDYCGSVSELSAITQYINNENRMSAEKCPLAKTILGIAIAEMIHLQKLGELIFLLGGKIDFAAPQTNGRRRLWTPARLTLPEQPGRMILADIQSERAAIDQYRIHMKKIQDEHINAVLERIIQDEEYHIMILQSLEEKEGDGE